MWEIVFSFVAAMARKFMHDCHADLYLNLIPSRYRLFSTSVEARLRPPLLLNMCPTVERAVDAPAPSCILQTGSCPE